MDEDATGCLGGAAEAEVVAWASGGGRVEVDAADADVADDDAGGLAVSSLVLDARPLDVVCGGGRANGFGLGWVGGGGGRVVGEGAGGRAASAGDGGAVAI